VGTLLAVVMIARLPLLVAKFAVFFLAVCGPAGIGTEPPSNNVASTMIGLFAAIRRILFSITGPVRVWKFYVCSAMLFVGLNMAIRIEKRDFGDSEIEVTRPRKSGFFLAKSAA
jgi:hypothetical protein